MARVVGICDSGVYVVLGHSKLGHTADDAILWDNLQINRALLKTYGRKVRRA